MIQKPKTLRPTFFSWKELSVSILQGIAITLGTLFVYQFSVSNGYGETLTRTMTFTTLIASNIFLTLINRSFYYSIFTTLRYKNKMVLMIISITVLLVGLILYVDVLTSFFSFETLNIQHLTICISVGFVTVFWYEFVKIYKRRKPRKLNS